MLNPCPRKFKSGFTLIELLVVIAVLFILVGLFFPRVDYVRERASRVTCLSNLNGIWRSISAWGLDPNDEFRPNFPTSNIVGPNGVLTPIGGVTPELFVCLTAARDYGTRSANTLSEVTASNSSYCYFSGWSDKSDKDGDRVLLCDQDGPMTIATSNHWGGNHSVKANTELRHVKHGRAEGGNIVKVSGAGMWVDSTNNPGKACITNAAIAAAFQPDSNTVVFSIT